MFGERGKTPEARLAASLLLSVASPLVLLKTKKSLELEWLVKTHPGAGRVFSAVGSMFNGAAAAIHGPQGAVYSANETWVGWQNIYYGARGNVTTPANNPLKKHMPNAYVAYKDVNNLAVSVGNAVGVVAAAKGIVTGGKSTGSRAVDDAVGGRRYTPPEGGGGVTESIKVGNQEVQFGHGARHVDGLVDVDKVNQAIAQDVVKKNIATGEAVSQYRVTVGGVSITYNAYRRSSGLISVGTYIIGE